MARAADVPQAKIDALANWRASPLFDSAERAALRMAEEVTMGPAASAACMAELARHYSPAEQVELVLTASFYACVGRVVDSFEVELEDSMRR
jgi:alkylhydroperoxidase family enzyme